MRFEARFEERGAVEAFPFIKSIISMEQGRMEAFPFIKSTITMEHHRLHGNLAFGNIYIIAMVNFPSGSWFTLHPSRDGKQPPITWVKLPQMINIP
jgi:hypothetical protein